ncbi:MAG TPA: DUF2497 domain-containing protein [Caulobacteraceae bacterium]|nr:DUF2497 domain-containing protein [Caulobacteraceae bacterium]
MSEPNVQEPTMEEILASIRRIISEDEPQGESAPAPEAAAPEPEIVAEAEADEVLELTEPLPQAEPEPEPEPVFETHGDIEAVAPPAPESASFAAAPTDEEPLISQPTEEVTTSAFGQLHRSVGMPKGGRTLEDVVREMLNPLLKAWLDEHLPTIVQAKVEEEVERIARRRVR